MLLSGSSRNSYPQFNYPFPYNKEIARWCCACAET